MPYKEYQSKWVSELPPLETSCPVCRQGIIEDNTFTSKKGQEIRSVRCKQCYTKWLKSFKSFSPAQKKAQQTSDQVLMDELNAIHQRLDAMGEWGAKIEQRLKVLEGSSPDDKDPLWNADSYN